MVKPIILENQNVVYELWEGPEYTCPHSVWSQIHVAEEMLEKLKISYPNAVIVKKKINNRPVIVGYEVMMNLTTGDVVEVERSVIDEEDHVYDNHTGWFNHIYARAILRIIDGIWMFRGRHDPDIKWVPYEILAVAKEYDEAIRISEIYRQETLDTLDKLPELVCYRCQCKEMKDVNSRKTASTFTHIKESPRERIWLWFCSDKCHDEHEEELKKADIIKPFVNEGIM